MQYNMRMKVYFTAAIFQKPQFGQAYDSIVRILHELGHDVIHEHITAQSLSVIKVQDDDERAKHYKKTLKRITESDLVVVEASFPSTLNIGHEISLALEKGKPVIGLYKKGYDSLFLSASTAEKLYLVEYTDEDLKEMLTAAIDYAKDQSDTRFNFFISPRHVQFLDWVARTKKIPRSVYLRRLIEADRGKHKEYFTS